MGSNPDWILPNPNIPNVYFLKNIVKNPNIIVGDYTYYSNDYPDFESRVTHHYDFIGDKLIIGKFCAIAKGIEFIMNGANHQISSISTYLFILWEMVGKNAHPI